MMYVTKRHLKIEKVKTEEIISRLTAKSFVSGFDGFVRKDVLVNRKDPNFDIIEVFFYWEDKKAYYRFQGSKEHIEMHKVKHPEPEGLIEKSHFDYELISSIENDKKSK